jgi:hypothetical protein
MGRQFIAYKRLDSTTFVASRLRIIQCEIKTVERTLSDSEGLSEIQELLWREIDRRDGEFNVYDLEICIKHVTLLLLDKILLMVDNCSVVKTCHLKLFH